MDAPVRSSPIALTVLALLNYKPLHPYGVQRLIKQWGKDQVINVSQRAGLYRTMERLQAAGLIVARDPEREHAYPERTVYEVTDAGRAVARTWITQMLSTPKAEFPEFAAALSHLLLLSRKEMTAALAQRVDRLREALQELDASLAAEHERGVPRVTMLETEYVRAVTAAELAWVEGVVTDLRSGTLTWSVDALKRLADRADRADRPARR